jgi:aminoglycoside phosphotransferase (APT) family kinase protein
MSVLANDDVAWSWAEAQDSDREPLLVLEPLISFLSDLGIAAGIPRVEPLGDGLSNATFGLSFEGGPELVLRRPPRGPLPPAAHDVLREADVITRLAGGAVPVPVIVAACDDAAALA